ncbi:unnamed protein product [Trichobilharzia szidati]|nr:unnamed protein product [Trichobilharzia szidati]
MYCLILCKEEFASGNLSTAKYLREIFELYLEAAYVKIVHVSNEGSLKDVENFNLSTSHPKIAIALHLRRCASLLHRLDKNIPILSVCTGSDLYLDKNHAVYLKAMDELVKRSFAVVLFNQPMLKQFKEIWPRFNGQLKVIHQAPNVDVEHAEHNKEKVLSCIESKLGVELKPFFIVVGRLRDVKDPMFALNSFLEWGNQGEHNKTASSINYKSYHLLYVGSVEEDTENVQQFIDKIDGKIVHRCDSLEQNELHSLMLNAQALINCSISEGQSVSIMEAMILGVPVIARENPGNCDLIKHKENGLIFKTSKEFGECLTQLEGNPQLRKQLISSSESFIEGKEFQREHQAKLYSQIIQEYFNSHS